MNSTSSFITVFHSRKLLMALLAITVIIGFSNTATAAEIGTDNTMGLSPAIFFLIFLVVSTVIGMIAVLAGVGGGVIFTPLMLGFTPIDSLIVRGTGLFVAMTGALVAARPFLKRGLANIRLLYFSAVPYATFAVIGALLAVYIKQTMGQTGEAYVRLGLGILVVLIASLFLFAGNRIEYPEVRQVDSFTRRVGLAMAYWEESLGRVVQYEVTRSWLGLVLFAGVGLVSGLFGLGAGWAMVPVLNLVMMAPLKVAAASSKVLIGIGDTAAIWPYIMQGTIFPLFAVPCMIGLILGTMIGAKIMLKVKAGFIRYIIIVIMFLSGARLIQQALTILGYM
ncbi:putative permease [Archaeoglobus sulfaticallidus PM70-1]|uniref:Probable membrane transporter protein n=1 Tax=Archaeoglobus sulfaticallidus PM70-1 TaxID=387631 RepID=N0BDQ0_9EURY|nr:sulfite exporter TauE/SafE family protein [Archaeoglobus sulfaticallidus]AGK60367.1 putative permease [Archaeoglobus sulfaticallidus PM70-1]